MRVRSIEINNFRSFDSLSATELGQITVLVGANNSGKSSILRALYVLQQGLPDVFRDVRVGSHRADIGLHLGRLPEAWRSDNRINPDRIFVEASIHSADRESGNIELALTDRDIFRRNVAQLRNFEVEHAIIPYMARRKTGGYQEHVGIGTANTIFTDFSNLSARLTQLTNTSFPGSEIYIETCKKVLGFVVTAVNYGNGMIPGRYITRSETILLSQMGEGVPNIVGLLASLALAKEKLFLIEELENDLHPTALKALLDLILESSSSNQFVISTHSNIVVRHLGGAPNAIVYRVDVRDDSLPLSAKVERVGPTPSDRISLLRELGYAFSDLDLWDGWLLLEESSAERIIRDYLIRWFAPKMSRVRLVSAGGTGEVEPTFRDFRRMVLFAHLEEAYKKTAWVRVDNDISGREVIAKLREVYTNWSPEQFATFPAENFETFYPQHFGPAIQAALAETDRQKRREAKRQLLHEVVRWLDEDESRGRAALEESAAGVIEQLRTMEQQLA